MTPNTHNIFISYASPDRSRVLPFYHYLQEQGFNVWIDCQDLKPGQNWDFEIKRALDKADFVLMFISENSVDRRGYVQRELKLAFDKLEEKLVDDIYLIPVLLDDNVSIPTQLQGIHCIKASIYNFKSRIVDALNYQLGHINGEQKETQEKEGITWDKHSIHESWDGLPGYEVELEYFEFHSELYPNINEISDYIKGQLLSALLNHRKEKLSQIPSRFNYGQNKFLRTSYYIAHCGEPTILGKVISITYNIDWYGAGAVHPNYDYKTYNFLLEPLFLIDSLREMLKEPKASFFKIQQEVRKTLYQVRSDPQNENSRLDPGWVDKGTSKWEDFPAFKFIKEGVIILFPPYRIGPFSAGSFSTPVPFEILAPLMRDEFVSGMQLHEFVNDR